MNEQSNPSNAGSSAMGRGADLAHDSVELIESEMAELRQQMKRLESRMVKLKGELNPVAISDTTTQSRRSESSSPQNNNILSRTSTPQDAKSSTLQQPLEKSPGTAALRSPRRTRKSRSRKVKRNLLKGYVWLTGISIVCVFIVLVVNLFSADVYLPTQDNESKAKLQIDESPDLEELRMSIQDAEE